MTIKKLALSTVAAAMVTTSVFAGTFTATSQTVGAEGVASDKSYLNNVDVNTSFTTSINGTLNQGSVIYTFTNVEINSTAIGGHIVYNTTLGDYVSSLCSAGSAGRIICDLNGSTITDGDILILDDNVSVTSDRGALLDFNLSAGFSGSTVSVALTNSATTTIDSGAATNIITTATEWSAAVGDKYNAQIDASDSFLSFANSATDDNATIVVTQTAVDLNVIATPAASWVVNPDRNVTKFGVSAYNGSTVNPGLDNNFTTAIATLAAGTYGLSFTPTVGGTVAIEEATYTTTLTSTFGTNAVTLLSAADLGGFTTYGYTGNIPGASYSAGVTDTVITLVNNQASASADTIVTIKDATGTSCTLTSASDSEVTKPTANSSTKYKLSTMLGNSGCSALTGTSYSIQVTLPTTPSSVFAQAAVVRTDSTSGISKVLPVYNNGTSY